VSLRLTFTDIAPFCRCAGLVAGAFGGLLAYALVHMNGIQGYSGWRWVLIIEGLPSIAASIPACFFLADWPEQAKSLSSSEKRHLASRLSADAGGGGGGGAQMNRLNKAAWMRILGDWKIYVAALIYLGITVSGYATALFVPTIVKSLGYSGVQAQVHSIPVWVVAAVVTLATALLTDRLKHPHAVYAVDVFLRILTGGTSRYGFVLFGVIFASIGYIILLAQGPLATKKDSSAGLPVNVRYMAVFFVCTGCYIVQPLTILWLANSLSGHYK
jgi:hypothetical protein